MGTNFASAFDIRYTAGTVENSCVTRCPGGELARATAFRDSHTRTVGDWERFADAVSTGWALALHCRSATCEEEVKSRTAATPRYVPGVREAGDLRARQLRSADHQHSGDPDRPVPAARVPQLMLL